METTGNRAQHVEIYKRCTKELCNLIGFQDHEALIQGGKIKLGDSVISLIHDDEYSPMELFVYVDMGPFSADDKARAYEALLTINFQLLAGSRGAMSLHPESRHVFYAFRYPLNDKATGADLFETLVKLTNAAGEKALALPFDTAEKNTLLRSTGRQRASLNLQGENLRQ